jgi:5-methylcytosine-specific restriction endonuclease McrA
VNDLPKSRGDAKAAGVTHYFTGKSCINGHVGRRFASNGSCELCATEQCQSWRKNNPGRAAEASRSWRANNAENVAQSKRSARSRNREKISQQEREYRIRNPDARKSILKSWRMRNVARIAEYEKSYRAANKERLRAYNSTRKAIRRSIEEAGIGLGTLLGWVKAQPKICFYCVTDCAESFHVDHFVPLAKGGAHVLTNLRIACAPCNLRKNARDPLEFMEAA